MNPGRRGGPSPARLTAMTVGEIAGLIAAVAFVLLVGMCAIPLFKLGKVLDSLESNIQLVFNNARVASQIACSLSKLENNG